MGRSVLTDMGMIYMAETATPTMITGGRNRIILCCFLLRYSREMMDAIHY